MQRIILTNDDGVEAPGLSALRRSVEGFGPCVVVAPSREYSGCSHSTTTGRPFFCRKVSDDVHIVDGTPADCARAALHLFRGQVAFVLSGINNGANLGVDVYHSGTIAAVREAALYGVRGIAISHYRDRTLTEHDWTRASLWANALLGELLGRDWTPGTFLNVNLPCVEAAVSELPPVVRCPLDPSPLPLSFEDSNGCLLYNGRYASRRRVPGCDVEVCLGGNIALTEISVMEASR
jgi:5'/3'-nucleotidase